MPEKKYISFDLDRGFPAGKTIHYECLNCGGIVPSLPEHPDACQCRNIIVDTDAGRVAVKSLDKFKAYRDSE